jgi:hypothetical protein
MTQHEYISIAIVIILGLAITRLLHTVALIVTFPNLVSAVWRLLGRHSVPDRVTATCINSG